MDSSNSNSNGFNTGGGGGGDGLPDPFEGSSSLDHALLESLFYNEMAQMGGDDDDTFSESSLFLGLGGPLTVSEPDGSAAAPTAAPAPPVSVSSSTINMVDPSVVAVEKEMLRGFGVTHSSPAYVPAISTGLTGTGTPNTLQAAQLPVAAASPATRPLAAAASAVVSQQQRNNQIAASRRGIRHNVAPVMTKSSAISEEEKHKKLVTQFATLAGRLGITLPPQVLQKLTANAAAKVTEHEQLQQQKQPSSQVSSTTTTTTVDPSVATKQATQAAGTPAPPPAVTSSQPLASASTNPPLVEQLQSTASEAIAAVTQKRSAPEDTSATSTKYSKRRKKPRLSDCERKLAELKSENALLKRHLDNISNAKRVTDSERNAAEQRMRHMLETNAPDEELSPVIQSFTELYSDYGRKRHQELNFHLEQLQRLANPTNFTKMGLWTLGGQSRNKTTGSDPIAGMLQKELGITQQQGRKIIEQRQKIQDVCSNLKECLVLLGKLKGLCETKTKIFHDRMTKCREILTPKQVVKLLIWIDENSGTLGSVCPGWGSEQFQTKPPSSATGPSTSQGNASK